MKITDYPNLKNIMEFPEEKRPEIVALVRQQNLKRRRDFRMATQKSVKNVNYLRDQIKDHFSKNIIDFVNICAFTYDPRLDQPHLPFVTYPYQDKFFLTVKNAIEIGQDIGLEKSRDMGFSWGMCALQAWTYLFPHRSSLYGSYKESYVDFVGDNDAHFERLRYIIKRIPQWLIPKDQLSKFMSISSNEFGCGISGDAGENFGTGGRRKFVILDEFSYRKNDKTAFKKTKDVTTCRIFGGTPNGRYNIYGKLMTNHPDYAALNIAKYRMHRTEHPLKTKERYEKQKRERTKQDLATELDLSYDESVQGAVYPDFQQLVRIWKFEYDSSRPIYTSWDFGRDMTAIIRVQRDFKTDRHIIIDAFQKNNTDIEFFAAFVLGKPTQGYTYTDDEMEMIRRHADRNRYSGHYGDPYNADNTYVHSKKNTIRKTLGDYGIYLTTRRDSYLEERIKATTLALRQISVDDSLSEFIQACVQSRYPSEREGAQNTTEKTKPIHDDNSHFRTCLEYYIDNSPEKVEIIKSPNPEEYRKYTDPEYKSTHDDQYRSMGI